MRLRLLPCALLFVVGCSAAKPDEGAASSDDEASKSKKTTHWTANGAPDAAQMTGGPWTLGQGPASSAAPSAGYCVGGVQAKNPCTHRMQPYYQPFIVGTGAHLQGYFDYRPKDNDEAIVAAVSDDFGQSWTFQQEALELTTACPASDAVTLGNDDGIGHPAVLTIAGTTFLYALDRTPASVDNEGLAVYALAPTPDAPLGDLPASFAVPQRATGLSNPDGILGLVPGLFPATIIYLEKQLDGDKGWSADQQCAGPKANHDVTLLRLATTEDGVHFTDKGALEGLNDPTDTTPTGTRYVGPRGTLILLEDGRFGLFFSGGNCLDADSDAFHYIGYAESTDLVRWRVVNDITAPIASIAPVTVGETTIPSTPPIVGDAQDWFAARVYGPSVMRIGKRTVSMIFSGYHTKKPKDDMGNYRTVGQVFLESTSKIALGSEDD